MSLLEKAAILDVLRVNKQIDSTVYDTSKKTEWRITYEEQNITKDFHVVSSCALDWNVTI